MEECMDVLNGSEPVFVRLALDPTLIPGIYNGCDQWCMYCPVTARCLAYRCNPEVHTGKRDIYRGLADRLYESLAYLKNRCAAEGRPIPEIDAMMADDPRNTQLVPLDDPIERAGRRYGQLSIAYLLSRPDCPSEMKPRALGPTPLEVFAWFHRLVPAKVYRALVSAMCAARGEPHRGDDALVSAKVALIGMDRSLAALAALAAEEADPRLEFLQAHLRRLRREVDGRFPAARSFVRLGFDAPADPVTGPVARRGCAQDE
jgi:hypothetical protein